MHGFLSMINYAPSAGKGVRQDGGRDREGDWLTGTRRPTPERVIPTPGTRHPASPERVIRLPGTRHPGLDQDRVRRRPTTPVKG